MTNTLKLANAIFAQLSHGKGARIANPHHEVSVVYAKYANNLVHDLLTGDYVHPTLRGEYKAKAREYLMLTRLYRLDARKFLK